MTKYMISFPSSAMVVAEKDLQAVAEAARAVIVEAQAAGVYVFAGGINEGVPPVKVSADGVIASGTYPQTRQIEGGVTILDVPTREAAVNWAAKLAAACQCDQELREFMYDPLS